MSNGINTGITYEDIHWRDLEGQPFGMASGLNAIVFENANNIIDVEGPMAVGGSFFSPRGLSIGFKGTSPAQGFSPDAVRFLIGGNVSMSGPLVVVGHVVVGGGFSAAKGSTYLIGKDGTDNQMTELKELYYNNRGSMYWTPSDKGSHYVIPSYDVPRYIPDYRIRADLPSFFANARRSIDNYKACIEALPENGTVIDNNYEWILQGSDPVQNVFLLDVRPVGLLSKGIRVDIPDGSLAIVKILSGNHAHLQYGLYGDERHADKILYVFEDATDIHMEKSSDIWGSILAPQATFHAHPTGGHVSGNVAINTFAVNENSGFEFHMYPFAGGVICPVNQAPILPIVEVAPVPAPVPAPAEVAPVPAPAPAPVEVSPVPVPAPAPAEVAPEQISCPECPVCQECPSCPEMKPCPECQTCPEMKPCPECQTCPEMIPCQECPTCPEMIPCPECPVCQECPECPTCPETKIEYIRVPVPVPFPSPAKEISCPDCKIKPGIIYGCIVGCKCNRSHDWNVELYQLVNNRKIKVSCIKVCTGECFEFHVPYDGSYILKICPIRRRGLFCSGCKANVTFKNIGVENLVVE